MAIVEACLTALSAGVLHILLGPDHLAAIMTLVVCQSHMQAFRTGLKWGVGHSLGLGLVALVIAFLPDGGPDRKETFSRVASYLAGGFMVLFGLFFCYKGIPRAQHDFDPLDDDVDSVIEEELTREEEKSKTVVLETVEIESSSTADSSKEIAARKTSIDSSGVDDTLTKPKVIGVATPDDNKESLDTDIEIDTTDVHIKVGRLSSAQEDCNLAPAVSSEEPHHHSQIVEETLKKKRRFAPRAVIRACVSLFAGMFAGIAGPGGLLAIVPTMYLDEVESICYILTFLVVSTIMMGLVALAWALLTTRLTAAVQSDKFRRCVFFFSCGSSVVVGVVWIILNAFDLLDEVFEGDHEE